MKKLPKAPTIEVRRMEPSDICNAVAMGKAVHTEYQSSLYPPVNEIAFHGSLLQYLAQGVVFLAVTEGKIIGMMALETFYYDWNPSVKYLRNAHFYVLKYFRKSNVSDLLLMKAREYAAETGAPFIEIGMKTDEDAEIKDRFLRIKGGRYVGGTFIFDPL